MSTPWAETGIYRVGFRWLHPPKKEKTKKTCGLSYGALQNPSFKEKVEWRQNQPRELPLYAPERFANVTRQIVCRWPRIRIQCHLLFALRRVHGHTFHVGLGTFIGRLHFTIAVLFPISGTNFRHKVGQFSRLVENKSANDVGKYPRLNTINVRVLHIGPNKDNDDSSNNSNIYIHNSWRPKGF